MKTELTTEQSQHLIELGVPKEKASIKKIDEIRIVNNNEVYDWSYKFKLTDILEILPKEMENGKYVLMIEFNGQYTFAYYYRINEKLLGYKRNKELIDVLYELACWYYGEYLKSEKK